MINLDSDALECDFAETYHIYDFRELPGRRAALYAVGLRDDSRIKRKMDNLNVPFDTLVLASITDKLSIIIQKLSANPEEPQLLTMALLEGPQEHFGFDTVEEFEAYREKLINEMEEGEDNVR